MLKADHLSSTSTIALSAGSATELSTPHPSETHSLESQVDPALANWRIYLIQRKSDRRGYVGVTRRSIQTRMAMHELLARRRSRLVRAGSLAEAVRAVHAQGGSFDQAFAVEILAKTADPDQARELERTWIARLGTAAPYGFNLMPGGASLGGPVNAEPVSIDHPRRGKLHYGSLMAAVCDINHERQVAGQAPLPHAAVYARRAMGWPVEEALELRPHNDGRQVRPLFRWHGRSYHSLDELARVEGSRIDTARSQLHRAKQAGLGPEHDAAVDRRTPGPWRREGVRCGRLPPLSLPHPTDPDADDVNAGVFARLSGVPKATVLTRYQRLRRRALDPDGLSRATLLAALLHGLDRRVVISLTLPDGQVLRGGVREVVRRVPDDPNLDRQRSERLGFSAIRLRLRRVPGWPENLTPAAVQWAFGFRPDANPVRTGDAAA
jgi:GIY-YIG catalytic domain